MKKFYLHTGAYQEGPFSIEDLRAKNISKETSIWYEGLTEWSPAFKIAELKELFIPHIPPPFKVTTSSSQEASSPVTTVKTKSSVPRILIVLSSIVLILIAVFVYQRIENHNRITAQKNAIRVEEETKKLIRENITSYVTAVRSSYNYSNLGGIYNLSISVTNSTNYIIDNVRVKVTYIKASGGIWKEKFVDYNLISPNTKITLRVPDEERGIRVEYEIASIRSNALGLN